MEFELWQLAVLFAAALIGGTIDAISGGGGMITLPALLQMGVPPHLALATNKFQGTFGSFSAALNFLRKGMIRLPEVLPGMLFAFIGAFIGTRVILYLDAAFLNYLIPVLLGALFLYMLFSPQLGEQPKKPLLKPALFYLLFGLLIGFYDGFFGPGTGSFWTFALAGILGLPLKTSVAQTKVFNFTSNIASLSVFIFNGNVLFLPALIMAAGMFLGGIIGSNLVIKKDTRFIKKIFLAIVGAVILHLIYRALTHSFQAA